MGAQASPKEASMWRPGTQALLSLDAGKGNVRYLGREGSWGVGPTEEGQGQQCPCQVSWECCLASSLGLGNLTTQCMMGSNLSSGQAPEPHTTLSPEQSAWARPRAGAGS